MPKTKTSKAKTPSFSKKTITRAGTRVSTRSVKKRKVSSVRASSKRTLLSKKKPVSRVKLRHKVAPLLLGRKAAHHKSLHLVHSFGIAALVIATVTASVLAGSGKWAAAANDKAICTGPCISITGASMASDKYWVMGQDGGVFSVNAPFYGSIPQSTQLNNAVGMVSTPNQQGYYEYTTNGAVYAFGNASYKGGSPAGVNNVVGFALRPQNDGYWMFGRDGGVFAYGNAPYKNSLPGLNAHVNNIVGGAPTSSGNGYWMVGADGGVFAFGDAAYKGSANQIDPGKPGGGSNSFVPQKPIVGMAVTPSGNGYWMVGADGGVFAFGDAVLRGSSGQIEINKPPGGSNSFVPIAPITGITITPSGNGYWMVGADGGVFAFGDAQYSGRVTSRPAAPAPAPTPAPAPKGGGSGGEKEDDGSKKDVSDGDGETADGNSPETPGTKHVCTKACQVTTTTPGAQSSHPTTPPCPAGTSRDTTGACVGPTPPPSTAPVTPPNADQVSGAFNNLSPPADGEAPD